MFGKMANMGPKSKIAQVQTLLTTDIEDEFKHFSTMNDDRYCTLTSLGVANNFAVFLQGSVQKLGVLHLARRTGTHGVLLQIVLRCAEFRRARPHDELDLRQYFHFPGHHGFGDWARSF